MKKISSCLWFLFSFYYDFYLIHFLFFLFALLITLIHKKKTYIYKLHSTIHIYIHLNINHLIINLKKQNMTFISIWFPFFFLILCLIFWTLVDLISSNDLVHLSIDYSYHKVLLFKTILSNCFLFLHVMCIARCSTWKTGIHSYSP